MSCCLCHTCKVFCQMSAAGMCSFYVSHAKGDSYLWLKLQPVLQGSDAHAILTPICCMPDRNGNTCHTCAYRSISHIGPHAAINKPLTNRVQSKAYGFAGDTSFCKKVETGSLLRLCLTEYKKHWTTQWHCMTVSLRMSGMGSGNEVGTPVQKLTGQDICCTMACKAFFSCSLPLHF